MTNLVQFPGLGLSFELSRVAFSIGGMDIYWYGVCIAFGLCLALVFAFRRCTEFGIDADSMVDVILIGVVLGTLFALLIAFLINHGGFRWTPPGYSYDYPVRVRVWGDWGLIIGSAVSLVWLAVLSAWWPARRASKLNIVDALRHV